MKNKRRELFTERGYEAAEGIYKYLLFMTEFGGIREREREKEKPQFRCNEEERE